MSYNKFYIISHFRWTIIKILTKFLKMILDRQFGHTSLERDIEFLEFETDKYLLICDLMI